tara:strand:- start:2253 stop:2483 length:231 start_codon:yes stop_codon:yes gene_type:complete
MTKIKPMERVIRENRDLDDGILGYIITPSGGFDRDALAAIRNPNNSFPTSVEGVLGLAVKYTYQIVIAVSIYRILN